MGRSEAGWRIQPLPAAQPDRQVVALVREARLAPQRLRVVVLPGSGCTGFAPFAERYFAGLLHAQVWALHKPGVSLQAGPAATDCPSQFVRQDAHASWLADVSVAMRALPEDVPTVLVGISEGAELVPALASHVPGLVGAVLLSSAGLDPWRVARQQAGRLAKQQGAWVQRAWDALETAASSSMRSDDDIVQGRTLRYWRDLRGWSMTVPLLSSPWPWLQVWGDADALVPSDSYEAFVARAARERQGAWCSVRLAGADHGLQWPDATDGVQKVWSLLERWARTAQLPCSGELSIQ